MKRFVNFQPEEQSILIKNDGSTLPNFLAKDGKIYMNFGGVLKQDSASSPEYIVFYFCLVNLADIRNIKDLAL